MRKQVPLERLLFLKKQLGFDAETQELLKSHGVILASHKEDFARYFEDFFRGMEETRPYLEVQEYPGQLQDIWKRWFEGIFTRDFDQAFVGWVWNSGMTHVRINLDHRFVNLGYCLARRFCIQVINSSIAPEERAEAMEAVEKTLDLCLLIETEAFLASTFQCDSEVIRGIAHQIRNPITVIGGSIMRLKRSKEITARAAHDTYNTILAESRRMEKMVQDVSSYNEVFHSQSAWSPVLLQEMLQEVLDECRQRYPVVGLDLQTGYAPMARRVLGNPEEYRLMFRHLLANAFEAVDPEKPVISVQTSLDPGTAMYVLVEIFNTGKLSGTYEMETLLTPFFSTRAMGTGLGLPIARVVAQKVKGNIMLYPVAKGGVVCLASLPRGDLV